MITLTIRLRGPYNMFSSMWYHHQAQMHSAAITFNVGVEYPSLLLVSKKPNMFNSLAISGLPGLSPGDVAEMSPRPVRLESPQGRNLVPKPMKYPIKCFIPHMEMKYAVTYEHVNYILQHELRLVNLPNILSWLSAAPSFPTTGRSPPCCSLSRRSTGLGAGMGLSTGLG